MLQRIFCVYDDKAKAFLVPFFMPTNGMAYRVFADCVNEAGHQFAKHPADYTLFCVGTFEQNNAHVELLAAMEQLCNGVMCVSEERKS